ncbi:hypothetical protein ACFL3T_03945 [Patescibacteria group bacterium]
MGTSENEIVNFSKAPKAPKAHESDSPEVQDSKHQTLLRVGFVVAGLCAAYATAGKDCSCKSCLPKSCAGSPEQKKPQDDRGHIPPNWPPPEPTMAPPASMMAPTRAPQAQMPNLPKTPKPAENSSKSEALSHEEVYNSIKENLSRNGALVVTADDFQESECIKYLRFYSGRDLTDRDPIDLTFENFVDGDRRHVGTKVTVPIKLGTRTLNIPIHVITQQKFQTSAGQSFTGGKKFSFVQVRGHSGDMGRLIEATKKHKTPEALMGLGGCSSIGLKSSICTPQTPAITQVPTGYSRRNSYLLIRVIDELMRHGSWEGMFDGISEHSKVAKGRAQDNIPGQPRYEQGCEGWRNFPKRLSGGAVRRKIISLRAQRDEWKTWRASVRKIKEGLTDQRKIAYVERQIQRANNEVGKIARQIESWKRKRRQRTRRVRRAPMAAAPMRTARNRRRRLRRRNRRRGRSRGMRRRRRR